MYQDDYIIKLRRIIQRLMSVKFAMFPTHNEPESRFALHCQGIPSIITVYEYNYERFGSPYTGAGQKDPESG